MSESNEAAITRRTEIRQVLESQWIGNFRARMCAMNEFAHWGVSDVARLFDSLPSLDKRKLSPHGPKARPAPKGRQWWKELAYKTAIMAGVDSLVLVMSPLMLATVHGRQGLRDLAQLHVDGLGSSFFVKAPIRMLQRGVETGEAVCVDRWGRFQLMANGYAAISHVWAETMGYEFHDEKLIQDERGLDLAHFNRIMSYAARSGHEWFWFDLLAIPQIPDTTGNAEFLLQLKTDVINSLVRVYKNADAVVILDSITMQLESSDLGDIAAVLCCGRWLTRMWTYQEIKLAREAVVITASSVVDFGSMIEALSVRMKVSEEDDKRWREVHKRLNRLLPTSHYGVSLADIALGCTERNTDNEVDYVRSLFAVLDLQWKSGWSYEDGIMHIVKSRPQEAARIANMNGIRGLPRPYSWAPKYLARLEGMVLEGFQATDVGLVGSWYTIHVLHAISSGSNEHDQKLMFNVKVLGRHDKTCEIQMELPPNWYPSLDLWVKEAVPNRTARLLCAVTPEPRPRTSQYASIALLAVYTGDALDGVQCHTGTVAGSSAVNYVHDADFDAERLTWRLS